jgi:hypothetical protein
MKLANTHTVSNGEATHYVFYRTPIVTVEPDKITLRHGGHETATTKRRMCQIGQKLGFSVGAKNKTWYAYPVNQEPVPFADGTATFSR